PSAARNGAQSTCGIAGLCRHASARRDPFPPRALRCGEMDYAVTLRDASPADADAIAQLRELRGFTRAEADEWFARVRSRPPQDAALHVACLGARVVAYGHAARFAPPP